MKELCRDVRSFGWMEDFGRDLRIGGRILAKAPAFTVVAVLILALAIGANVVVFSVVKTVLLDPLPYREPERLVGFEWIDRETGRYKSSGIGLGARDVLAASGAFQDVAVSVGSRRNWTGTEHPEELDGAFVSTSFFDVLGTGPVIGRGFVPGDAAADSSVVVISHDLWQRRYGADSAVIGRTVALDGAPHTIVGVLPREFVFPGGGTMEFYEPHVSADGSEGEYGPSAFVSYARINPGLDRESAAAITSGVATVLEQDHPESNADLDLRLTALDPQVVPFYYWDALTMLQISVTLLLVIACVNLATLLSSRGITRLGELQVRASMGASRWRLLRQLLTEGFLLSLSGGAFGLLLGGWVLKGIPALAPEVPRIRYLDLDLEVVAFAAGLAILCGFLFNLFPAFAGPLDYRRTVSGSHHRLGAVPDRHRRLRSPLIAVEVALTLTLLILAGLTSNSFFRLGRIDPGFETGRVLTMQVRPPSFKYQEASRAASFYEEVVTRVNGLAEIEVAAAASHLPMLGTGGTVPLTASGTISQARLKTITPGFFRTLRLPIVAGRGLEESDRAGQPPVAIVSQSLAERLWPDRSPLGQPLAVAYPSESTEFVVVGIAQDVVHHPLRGSVDEVYVALGQAPWKVGSVYLVARTSVGPAAVADIASQQVWSVDPDQPVTDIATYDSLIRRGSAYYRFLATIQSASAILALLISAVGLYGVISYTVGQRKREIGIRIALGARRAEVVRTVLKESTAPVIAGVVIGLAGTVGLVTYVRSALYIFLFDITATDPGTYLAATACLLAVATAAAFLPAGRASRLDPASVLRAE